MGSVYRRGGKLWLAYADANGERQWRSSGLKVGQEAEAKVLLEMVEAQEAALCSAGLPAVASAVTVRAFAKEWWERRERLGISEWRNDRGRLRKHVLPHIGNMPIEEVRARHLIEVVDRMRSRVSVRTVHKVYGSTRTMFRDAKLRDVIREDPCVLSEHHLGKIRDKDPEWRASAKFSRRELQLLISDPRLDWDQHVFYALFGLAAMRTGEICGLRWRHYDPSLKPLGQILIATSYDRGKPKTGIARKMPVHPVLAAILAEWRLEGWPKYFGRAPQPDDLVLPLPPKHAARRRTRRGEAMRRKDYCGKRQRADFETLGIRHRRGYDLRRTFITLAQEDGARGDLLKRCTHTPASTTTAFDLYVSFSWEALSAEVAKLEVTRIKPAEVIELRKVAESRALVDATVTVGVTAPQKPVRKRKVTEWRRRESKIHPVLSGTQARHDLGLCSLGIVRIVRPVSCRPVRFISALRCRVAAT